MVGTSGRYPCRAAPRPLPVNRRCPER
jgi:hypothetical protein